MRSKIICLGITLVTGLVLSGLVTRAYAEITHVTEVGYYDTPGWAFDVTVSGNYAYVADSYSGLRIINISNPGSPSETGFYDTPGWAHDVAVSGNYAYVADYASGLRIINISNPSSPYETGFYDTPGSAQGVVVSGNYAYVADSHSGLRIINISDPSLPFETGFYDTPGSSYGVTVSGDYAYVGDANALRIINISNPGSPYEAGFYDMPDYSYGVVVSGNYTYVADSYSGLRIINISNPGSPYEMGYHDTPGSASGIAVSENYAYVADYASGLRIINISNPSSPYETGNYATPGHARGVAVSGNYAYVADRSSGLRILYCFPAPIVSSLGPQYSLVNSQINFSSKGTDFENISAIQLKNANQTIIGSCLEITANSLTAYFSLPAEPGLFDLVLSKGTYDFVFKTAFTLLTPLSGPAQWQMNDLGRAGNPGSAVPSSIVIADADHDNQAEVYVADNDRMIFCYKKNPDWTINYIMETPGENFQQLLAADLNHDRNWEIYAASAQPQTYQCLWNDGAWQRNTVCPYGTFLAWGDGNHDGVNELYAISGNTTTGQGIVQCSYANGLWTSSVVQSEQSLYAFTSLLVGDGDNDQTDEVYAANQDHYLYQFKYNGSTWQWQGSIALNVGNGRTTSLVLGNLDRDEKNEVYAANEDGKIYQLKWTGSAWASRAINTNSVVCNQIAVSDGDNDGQDEIYGAGQDGHAYQFRLQGSAWQMIDLGQTGTSLHAIAVGDGDNNFRFEVYAVGANGHVYQFQAANSTPTVTPTLVQIPEQRLRVWNSQINPTQGEQAYIRWYQFSDAPATIRIYNLLGDLIAILADKQNFAAGQTHEIIWRGTNARGAVVGSGIYLVHIQSGDYRARAKICVVK